MTKIVVGIQRMGIGDCWLQCMVLGSEAFATEGVDEEEEQYVS